MNEPITVINGVKILLVHDRHHARWAFFTGPEPHGVRVRGFQPVTTGSTVDGHPFTVLNGKVTRKAKGRGKPFVLLGAKILVHYPNSNWHGTVKIQHTLVGSGVSLV